MELKSIGFQPGMLSSQASSLCLLSKYGRKLSMVMLGCFGLFLFCFGLLLCFWSFVGFVFGFVVFLFPLPFSVLPGATNGSLQNFWKLRLFYSVGGKNSLLSS